MDSPRGVDAGASPPTGSLFLPHRSVDSFSLQAAAPASLQDAHAPDGPDEGPDFQGLDSDGEDAADLAMRLLDGELNFDSSEEQGDSDSEKGVEDDGDGSIVDLLETRLCQDGVGAEEARRIAEQVVQVRTQREEWESVRANIEAANAAYDEILSEFAVRKREIEGSGVEVKMGPMPCVPILLQIPCLSV